MDQTFHELCQTFLENAAEYNKLLTSLSEHDNLSREEFLAYQKKIAEAGNYAYTNAEPLFRNYLFDIFKNPLRLSHDETKTLRGFGEKCVQAGDELLAIEIYKSVIKAADLHDDVSMKIGAIAWYMKLCQMKLLLNNEIVSEIDTIFDTVDYEDDRLDNNARLNYAILYFYKANAIIENPKSRYPDILQAFRQAEVFFNYKILVGNTDLDWKGIFLPELHTIAAATASLCEFNNGRPEFTHKEFAKTINDIISSFQTTLYESSMETCIDHLDDIINNGMQVFRFVGWVITAHYSGNEKLLSRSAYLGLLYDIAKKISETPDADDYMQQIYRLHAAIHACGILSKHIHEWEDTEAQNRCHAIIDATLAMIQRQPKSVLLVVSGLREELVQIARTSSHKLSRWDFIKLMLKLTSHTHIPTYAHSLVVARLNKITTQFILENEPELLSSLLERFESPLDLIHEMELAGFGHDLGKVEINNGPISQNSRPLTDAEYFGMIQQHPIIGSRYLSGGELEFQHACALFHHTYYRGSGPKNYPRDYPDADKPLLEKYKAAIEITHDSDVRHAISDNLGRAYTNPRTPDDSQRICVNDSYERGGAIEVSPAAAEILKANKKWKRDITWKEDTVAELTNFVSVENILQIHPELQGEISRIAPGIIELSPTLAALTQKYPELRELHKQVLLEYNKDAYYEAYCELVKTTKK
ncbi:MAG: hypothetical protein LBI19_00150 [Oscillospiraceae bacterium]|jgi:hypothetical protein|nr:hypothetical protein [Oscillospiraceae bacterium]